MSAGAMSERLTIQTAPETTDSQGGRSKAWSTLAPVWGELVPIGTSERMQANAVGSHVLYRFRIYTRADVTPSMRVLWTPRWPASQSAQTLQITGVQHEPSRASMLLDCAVVQ